MAKETRAVATITPWSVARPALDQRFATTLATTRAMKGESTKKREKHQQEPGIIVTTRPNRQTGGPCGPNRHGDKSRGAQEANESAPT
jgi:hypothetical protein